VKLVPVDSDVAALSISRDDSVLMGNVFNEFINGIRITEDELERRLGCGRSGLRSVHDQLTTSHRSVWPDQGDSSKAESTISLSLTRTQLETMSRALRNLASGADIEAWEFPIRLGVAPEDALRLANDLDHVTESWPA
jgi:hypothetical protein